MGFEPIQKGWKPLMLPLNIIRAFGGTEWIAITATTI